MTLTKYIENLQKLIKENPGAGEMEVIFAADDEGNSYDPVHYTPGIGQYNPDGDWSQWKPYSADAEEDNEDYCTKEQINAICIN